MHHCLPRTVHCAFLKGPPVDIRESYDHVIHALTPQTQAIDPFKVKLRLKVNVQNMHQPGKMFRPALGGCGQAAKHQFNQVMQSISLITARIFTETQSPVFCKEFIN